MAITLSTQQLTTVARDTSFSETISANGDDGETINSISISGTNIDAGITLNGATISGQYINQFNDEIYYITKGRSTRGATVYNAEGNPIGERELTDQEFAIEKQKYPQIEKPVIVNGTANVPPNKDIVKFNTDSRAFITKTYSVSVGYNISLENGLTLSDTQETGFMQSPSGTIRGSDFVMACTIRFPNGSATHPACLFEQGGSGIGTYVGFSDSTSTGSITFRCRAGEGDSTSAVASTTDGVVLDISDYPTDGQLHEVIWEVRVNPGRVRLWIDGVLKGEEDTVGGGRLESGKWTGGNAGGYTERYSGIPIDESTNSWIINVSTIDDASDLRIYYDQLVLSTSGISDTESFSITQQVDNDTDGYVNWLTNYLDA